MVALIRISASDGTSSLVSTITQSRPSRRLTSASSDSIVSSLLLCSRTKPSNSLATTFVGSSMMPSVSMPERILLTINSSKRRALNL